MHQHRSLRFDGRLPPVGRAQAGGSAGELSCPPATVNSEAESLFAANVARELVGDAQVITDLEPSMGSEDFAFMLMERPGAYFRLGQGGAAAGRFLHNACYDFNDEVLPLGASLFARLAERALSSSSDSGEAR